MSYHHEEHHVAHSIISTNAAPSIAGVENEPIYANTTMNSSIDFDEDLDTSQVIKMKKKRRRSVSGTFKRAFSIKS